MNHDNIEEIKRIELNILREFVSVCDKIGVNYYLGYGTMLGAVRHKGFIPWDDDIDVVMMRDDYNKFIEKAQELLPENMFLQNYMTEKDSLLLYSKIRDSNTTFIEESRCMADINHGIFIDIFPLDYCYDEEKKQKKILKKVNFRKSLLSPFYTPITSVAGAYSGAKKIAIKIKRVAQRLIFSLLYGSKKNIYKLLKDIDILKQSVPKSRYVCAYGNAPMVAEELFRASAEYVFEKDKFLGVKDYDSYLSSQYGDYMQLPPEDKRKPWHYTTVIDTERSYKEYIK